MGWMQNLVSSVRGAKTVDLTLVENLADPGLDIAGAAIAPDDCYLEIYVESLRLEQARRFATRFNGLVYCFARLSQQGAEDVVLAAVSKPDGLANLDPDNLDRVITVSNRMIGAVPWRGGSLGLELGLFSVKQGNLLSPVLDYVAKVAEAGGLGFIGQVKPFLPLIAQGVDLIAGQTEDCAIEVALDTDMRLDQSRLCAVIALPKGDLDVLRLTLDPRDRKLLYDGAPLQEAYCVFSIRCTDQKSDFGAIPELKAAWGTLMTEIRSGSKDRAQAALATFRLTALSSPDLIPRDQKSLIEKATEVVKLAFPSGPKLVGRGEAPNLEDMRLEDVKLYN